VSHFTVLVIGDDPEDQLAPYHEFECTGRSDKYVQDLDETEYLRNFYETRTTSMLKDVDGKYHKPYQDCFFREPTEDEAKLLGNFGSGSMDGIHYRSQDWGDGKGYRSKVHFLPDGFESVDVPYKEIMTFTEFVRDCECRHLVAFGDTPNLDGDHKYGYALLDDKGDVWKVINRTNPNRKWDWYLLGGRWQGFFKLKEGAKGKVGKAGIFADELEAGYADQAYKDDIDFEIMKSEGKGYVTFAVIKDGQWFERGSMGWWGHVSDETDKDEWESKFSAMLDEIPGDTLLSVFDCHI
jgi:hypothetical protein